MTQNSVPNNESNEARKNELNMFRKQCVAESASCHEDYLNLGKSYQIKPRTKEKRKIPDYPKFICLYN